MARVDGRIPVVYGMEASLYDLEHSSRVEHMNGIGKNERVGVSVHDHLPSGRGRREPVHHEV